MFRHGETFDVDDILTLSGGVRQIGLRVCDKFLQSIKCGI